MKAADNNSTKPDIARWFDEHAACLLNYALLRVHHPAIAEDLVQDTFVAAIQSAQSFQAKSSERTWLIGILRHKIFDYFRTVQHEPVNIQQETSEDYFFDEKGHWKNKPANWQGEPAGILQNNEFWDILHKCIKGLSQLIAQAFVMRTMEDVSSDDICKELNISSGTLWMRLSRARLQLRQCLEMNWFEEKRKP